MGINKLRLDWDIICAEMGNVYPSTMCLNTKKRIDGSFEWNVWSSERTNPEAVMFVYAFLNHRVSECGTLEALFTNVFQLNDFCLTSSTWSLISRIIRFLYKEMPDRIHELHRMRSSILQLDGLDFPRMSECGWLSCAILCDTAIGVPMFIWADGRRRS
jgi:hypothetical protein